MSGSSIALPHVEVELISAYLDGELAPAEVRGLEAHLAGCPECSHLRETMDAARSALRALPRPAPPPAIGELLRKAVAAERERRPRPQWLDTFLPWRTMQPGLAAVVLVLVTAGLVVRHLERQAARPGESTVAAPRSPEEREREAAAGPTVPRPPASERQKSALRDDAAPPRQPAPEPSAVAATASAGAENAAGGIAAQGADTPAMAEAELQESAEFAPAPPAAAPPPVEVAGTPAETGTAAPASRPDARAGLSRAPAARVAPRTERDSADAAAKSAAATGRAAGSRQFDLVSGVWLERGLRPEARAAAVLFRTDPDARKLIDRWPEIDALAAEGRPVRFRDADGRIVEVRP